MCSHRNVTLCRGEDTFLFSWQRYFLLPDSVIKVLPSSVFLLVYLDSRSRLNQVYFSIVVFCLFIFSEWEVKFSSDQITQNE